MRVFMLTCPQLITLCEHYLGASIDRDKLRDSVYRDNILKLRNRGYLKIEDEIFLEAKITEEGKIRVRMAMMGDKSA